MGSSVTQECAEALLERLEHEAKFLSNDQIESINDTLARATAVLRRAHNERCVPLFKLPVEILHKIFEFVPDVCTKRWDEFNPFWRSTLVDSSMLIPVTRTCRRLREVALAHPHLWTTFQTTFEDVPLIRKMATWSKHVPLNAVGSDVSILEEILEEPRFGSIHLYDMGACPDFSDARTIIQWSTSPALRSFSLSCSDRNVGDADEDTIPLTLQNAPNLRDLTLEDVHGLPETGFPNLTHLALLDVYTYNFHARLVGFIRECPRLESVALSGVALNLEEEDVPDNSSPIPLQHLRHVTFHDFSQTALEFYIALLPPRVPGSSVQVLGYHARDDFFSPQDFLVSPDSNKPSTQFCIGVHPNDITEPNFALSLTTITPNATRRISAWSVQLRVTGTSPVLWPAEVLEQWPVSALVMEEVWLYGVAPSWTVSLSPLQYFDHVRTAVIVIDRSFHHGQDAEEPTLSLLPSSRDSHPLPNIGTMTTLRLVHGFSDHHAFLESMQARGDFCRAVTQRVSLGRMIKELESGGYGYLKHFVLQVTPHIYVDEKELGALRALGRFETFRFERIDALPDMPGHSDPARRGCERYPGSLW